MYCIHYCITANFTAEYIEHLQQKISHILLLSILSILLNSGEYPDCKHIVAELQQTILHGKFAPPCFLIGDDKDTFRVD